MVQHTTPREVLYMETGLLDIKSTTDKNRIMMKKRLQSNTNVNDLMNKINQIEGEKKAGTKTR